MKKIKNIFKAVKAWDKKHTNFHSGVYMMIFLTASIVFLNSLKVTIASI